MEYEIKDMGLGQELVVKLKAGEEIWAEGGAFVWGKGAFDLEAKMQGGLVGGLLRAVAAGESLFLSRIYAQGDAEIGLAPAVPSSIVPVEVKGQLLMGDGVYLAHVGNVEVSAKWGGLSSLIAGSGLFFSYAQGDGVVFLAGFGGLNWVELKEGESIVVDNTNFVAVNAEARIEKVKVGSSLIASLLSSEAFAFRIYGPAVVYYRASSTAGLAALISHFLRRR